MTGREAGREPAAVPEESGPSRGAALTALLELLVAAIMGDGLEVGRSRARDAAELVDDVVFLQRVAAGLATMVVFELAQPKRPPRTVDELRDRMRFLRAWVLGVDAAPRVDLDGLVTAAPDPAPMDLVMHAGLDVLEGITTAETTDDAIEAAHRVTEGIDDVEVLRRIAAALAVIAVFRLGPERIRTDEQRRVRLADVRGWVEAERLEALWVSEP